MGGKDKNKQIPVPCKMFLRFIKERGLFHEWRVEGENRVRSDFASPFVSSDQKFYSFACKWQWYVIRSSTMYAIIYNPIYNVIGRTLYWSRTKHGRSFWLSTNDTWMDIYRKYHKERQMDSLAYGKPMTDDLETFVRVMKSELHKP